jgi:hypothetical protein
MLLLMAFLHIHLHVEYFYRTLVSLPPDPRPLACVASQVHPLIVYTGQNPRRRVVSVKTSQMRTTCTLIWIESCLLVYIFTQLLFWGGTFL